MRIPDSRAYQRSLTQLREGRARAMTAQSQAMTGIRVAAPSDDPAAMAAAHREKAREGRAVGHQRSIDAGLRSLSTADDALSEAGGVMARLRELAVMFSSDTSTSADRAAGAAEVRELREALRGIANTRDANGYVFGGFRDDSAPFDVNGLYAGDDGVRELEVAKGVRIASSVPGSEVFGAAGGVDVFAEIDAFELALTSDDATGIRASITTLEDAGDQLLDARGRIGAHMRGFEVAHSVAERVELRSVEAEEKLVGIDPAEAYLAFSRATTALEAAVRIAAQLPLPGLASNR